MCLDVVFVLYLSDRSCVWMSFLFCICLTVYVFGCRFCLTVYVFGCRFCLTVYVFGCRFCFVFV